MKRCPVCKEPLASMSAGGVIVDGCQRCGGVWFDHGELTRLAKGDLAQLRAIDHAFAAAPGSAPPQGEPGTCPICDTVLVLFQPPHTPDLSLRACPTGHGTWLGEEEFERILERVQLWREEQRGSRAAPPPPAPQRVRDAAHWLLSCPCPQCQQPNALASPACWACGAVLQSSLARFHCPFCAHGLDSIFYEKIPLNPCIPCGSLWLDQGELGALIQLPREILRKLERRLEPSTPAPLSLTPTAVLCPACHEGMDQHEYGLNSGILIYRCQRCQGLWLDHAALVPIQRFALGEEAAARRGSD